MTLREALIVLASHQSTSEQFEKAQRVLASASAEKIAEARAALASEGADDDSGTDDGGMASDDSTRVAASQAGQTNSGASANDDRMTRLEIAAASGWVDSLVARSGLPQKAADRVVASISKEIERDPKLRIDRAAVEKRTTEEIDVFRSIADDVRVTAGGPRIDYVAGREDKLRIAMEQIVLHDAPPNVVEEFDRRFHGGEALDVRASRAGMGGSSRIRSLHHLYREFAGVDVAAELFSQSERGHRARASISTSTYTTGWGDTLNRATIAYYTAHPYDLGRLVRRKPLKDFRTQRNIHFGGYGDLPIVGERAAYEAFTTPGERSNSYAPETRGATEDWSRRAMINDDIQRLSMIPRSIGRSAKRTLFKFVTDKFTIAGQPTMDYDATALFHANHNNLRAGSYALAAATLKSAYIAMLQQTDFASGEELGIRGVILMFPTGLVGDAYDAVKSLQEEPGGSTTDRAFIVSRGIQRFHVPTWTSQVDWVLYADPNEYEGGFELGFINGQEEPELFLADGENVGLMFLKDVVVVKCRHEYGGAFADHAGVYANDVS